jgi:hypothetical protein
MRTRLVRRPGQHGTQDLVAQYGDRLICVRYRYDEVAKKRHKTVERIVETVDWRPRPAPDTIVGLRGALEEYNIQQTLRRAGGVWNRARRVWEIRYDRAVSLGLTDRIVEAQ